MESSTTTTTTSTSCPPPQTFISKYKRDPKKPEKPAIENVPGYERLPVLSKDREYTRDGKTKTTKKFAWFRSLADVGPFVNQFSEDTRVFYEYVRGPQKFHIDIDVSKLTMDKAKADGHALPEDLQCVAYKCLALCVRGLVELSEGLYAGLYFPRRLEINDLVICESHREGKYSWHITTAGFYFASHAHCREIYDRLVEIIKTFFPAITSFADPQVYSVKQQWRLLGSHKIGIPNTKKIMCTWPELDVFREYPPLKTDWSLKDTMLQRYGDEEVISFPIERPRARSIAQIQEPRGPYVPLREHEELNALIGFIDWRKRLSTRDGWLQALRAFHHEGKGSEEYLDYFDRQLCRKYWPEYAQDVETHSAENHQKWAELSGDHQAPTTIGTLHKWAREDDKAAYERWNNSRVFSDEEIGIRREEPANQGRRPREMSPRFLDWATRQILDCNERGLARVLLRLWRRDLVFDGVEIYHWNRHRLLWGTNLSGFVAFSDEDLIPVFVEMRRKFPPIEKGQPGFEERLKLLKAIEKREGLLNTHNGSVKVAGLVKRLIESEFKDDCNFPLLLDSKPDLYPLEDKKIVNLLTGEVRERTREDFFTRTPPIRIGQQNPLIEELVLADCCGDRQLYDYLHRVIGYTLTGYMRERKMFILHGEGSNGKSQLLDLMMAMMRGYSAKAPDGLFIKKKRDAANNGHTEHMRPLVGNRLVFYSELSDGAVLDDSLIKTITGGDTIAFRGAGEHTINIIPTAKLFLLTNKMPDLSDVNDSAMLARLVCIPFNARFVDDPKEVNEYKKDDALLRDIKEHKLDDFFYWALQGSKAWHQRGLDVDVPECVRAKKREYIHSQNTYEQWVEERIDREDTETWTLATKLLDDYKAWLFQEDPDKKPPGVRIFGKNIKPFLGEPKHKKDGNYYKAKLRPYV